MSRRVRSLIVDACLASAAAGASLFSTGCASLPQNQGRPVSHTLTDTADTTLARVTAEDRAVHPGQSGFHPLVQGADAFVARLALARAAERTIDLQYYIFFDDDTGLALIGELLKAADRGVRVRFLLDDIHTAGKDSALATLAAHPNIEVRIFNPFAHRSSRWLDFVGDFSRVNRRMHNKSFTADNQATIVGGRNIGNSYFAAHSDVDFSDLDVLALGPVVSEVSAVFDEYWNCAVAYPIETLHAGPPPDEAAMRQMHEKFAQSLEAIRATPYARGLADTDLAEALRAHKVEFFWGNGYVIADRAEKVTLPPADDSTHAGPKLRKFLSEAQNELLLVSPYFVPGDDGVKWLQEAIARGVKVRILTNSYTATDVGPVHAGYSAYRKDMLKAGVELYELKPTAGGQTVEKKEKSDDEGAGSSHASLHAKTYMVDRRKLFIGSLNLDPRSQRLNTEMGIILESEAICRRFQEGIDAHLLDFAYRVELDPKGHTPVWITRENGKEVRLETEPGVGAFTRIVLFIERILPVEEQL